MPAIDLSGDRSLWLQALFGAFEGPLWPAMLSLLSEVREFVC